MSDIDTTRRVIASTNISIDGYTAEPDQGMGFLFDHAGHEQMSAHFEGVWRGCDTAILGRINYEGFAGFWPSVAEDAGAAPRDRDLAHWLNTVTKVVFSRTLTETTWQNSRIADKPLTDEVRELKRASGRDIIVLNSASVIRELLHSGLVDELRVNLIPAVVGKGLRLFEGDLPSSAWRLYGTHVLPSGAVGLCYRRS